MTAAVRRCHDRGLSGWMLLFVMPPILGQMWLVLSLITARSYGQHNTVVYKTADKYRGMPHRQTILMNPQDLAASGLQLRESPVGFRSQFHCTGAPQWLFVLRGQMEIGLQDGSSRTFGPGDHFYSADTLPEGATFDPAVHGHWSRQVGDQPLVTLFVRG